MDKLPPYLQGEADRMNGLPQMNPYTPQDQMDDPADLYDRGYWCAQKRIEWDQMLRRNR